MRKSSQVWIPILLVAFATVAASAQSFRVQCPTSTITHPLTGTNCATNPTGPGCNNTEPAYNGPTQFNPATSGVPAGTSGDFVTPVTGTVNGAIKCMQISGGDGYSTMADGNQIFMFSFGPLSGLADIAAGRPGTQFPYIFNTTYAQARGVAVAITGASESGTTVTILSTLYPDVNDTVIIAGVTPPEYNGTFTVTARTPTSFTYVDPAALGGTFVSGGTAQDTSGLTRGDPATTDGATSGAAPWTSNPVTAPAFTWNGAVGQTPDVAYLVTVANLIEGTFPTTAPLTTAGSCTTPPTANTVTAWTDAPFTVPVGQAVLITSATAEGGTTTPPGYAGTWTVSCVSSGVGMSPDGVAEYVFQYTPTATGLPSDTGNDLAATASSPSAIDGHVDPRPIMDVGVMNGNIPAPLFAFDEDDEFFLTLTNVGMIMRPDLFEQHTVHFHGYPNASSFYDGVPDASIAINIGASFTYYYLAPDAGTYFWHCHITPPEHLQMGMVGQLYVRPRQDRVPVTGDLYTYLGYQNGMSEPITNPVVDGRTVCNPSTDILCSATMPVINTGATRLAAGTLCNGATPSGEGTQPQYVYNDGDASSCYDVVYPLQMHGFDPNFHFVGMTFNPELFADMNDKYFLLNGRSYPDTVAAGPQATITSDGQMHYSQPLPAIINIPAGGKASLRLVNLSVAEYFTLQSLGVPMHEVGFNAKLLRDQAGVNTAYYTNSITLGGGESNDVILDASDAGCGTTGCAATLYPPGSVFYLYEPDLDRLSNDLENFGGMMTEVHIN